MPHAWQEQQFSQVIWLEKNDSFLTRMSPVHLCSVWNLPGLVTEYFLKIFIYLFILAALGLHCCVWALSCCGERGLLFVVVHGLLIAVASLVAEHGL